MSPRGLQNAFPKGVLIQRISCQGMEKKDAQYSGFRTAQIQHNAQIETIDLEEG